MLEYCKATVDDLSRVGCVDTLEGIREDIMGVSMILSLMAGDGMPVEPEQLLVCNGVLRLAADALETAVAQMKEDAGFIYTPKASGD